MRAIIGASITLAGIILSAYFALVVMFVGGISKIIDEFNAESVDGGAVGWGIAQIVFAGTVFGLGAWLSVFIGALISGRFKRSV